MKVSIEKNELVIRLALQPAHISSGGKLMMVASSEGWVPTDCAVDGKPVKVNVMAGYKA